MSLSYEDYVKPMSLLGLKLKITVVAICYRDDE